MTHTCSSAWDLYLCYGVKCKSGVIWSHWGQKVTIRLIQVDQLETLYLCYGVKCQSGVIWVTWGQKVIFTKIAITHPCYIALPQDSCMFISLRPSTYVMGSNVNLGSFGVTGVKRWFILKCYNSSMLQSMTIRLIQVDQLDPLLMLWGQMSIWGHLGSQGLKSHFQQKCYFCYRIHGIISSM